MSTFGHYQQAVGGHDFGHYRIALCERVLQDGQATLAAALKLGITIDDFIDDTSRHLWGLIVGYHTEPNTRGSALPAAMLRAWFPKNEPADTLPGLTLETLVFHIRRERVVTGVNAALVSCSHDIAAPMVDPSPIIGRLLTTLTDLAKLGSGADDTLEADELFTPMVRADWVIEDLGIEPGPPTLFVGFGASAKTIALQSLALSLACAEDRPIWDRLRRARRCRVLHVDYEQGDRVTKGRYQRLGAEMGIGADAVRGYLTVRSMPSQRLALEQRPFWLSCAQSNDVVLVDSFAAATAGAGENEASARAPLDMLTSISQETGCTFLVVHHSGKTKPDDLRMAGRGASAIFDASGVQFFFEVERQGIPGQPDQPTLTSTTQTKTRTERGCPPFTLRIGSTLRGGVAVAVADEAARAAEKASVLEEQITMYLRAQGGSWTGSVAGWKRELGVRDGRHKELVGVLARLKANGRMTTSQKRQQTIYVLMDTPTPVTGHSAVPPNQNPFSELHRVSSGDVP